MYTRYTRWQKYEYINNGIQWSVCSIATLFLLSADEMFERKRFTNGMYIEYTISVLIDI